MTHPKGELLHVHILQINLCILHLSSNRVHMGFYMQKEEGFYGFGERFVNTFFILVITSSLGLITAIREVIGLGHGVRTAHLD